MVALQNKDRLGIGEYATGLPASSELLSLRKDVEALASELLNQYEEITLLYDLARNLGVVVNLEDASRTALERSLEVIPAALGLVLVGQDPRDLEMVALAGDPGEEGHRCVVAYLAAEVAIRSGSQVMVHAGGSITQDGASLDEPVLAAPLVGAEAPGGATRSVGALVFVGHQNADRFSAGEAQLASVVARQLGQGMENARLIGELRQKERLESELALAAQIQRSLLPRSAPRVPGATLAARCLPAAQVGGDYYDFVAGANGAVYAVVADVTGHGFGPGLIMAMTRSVLRAKLLSQASMAQALAVTNSAMWDDLLATEAFITLFAVKYDPGSKRLGFVNGGHHPALLRHRNGAVSQLSSDGMPLGVLETPSYEEKTRDLEQGEVLLIFSDGVVESCSPDGAEFGTSRLQALLADAGGGPVEVLIERLLAELASFHGPGPRDDDITVVALRVADDPSDDSSGLP